MPVSLSILQEKIITHPYFQKTRTVIEDNACHKKEPVYDHLHATAGRAEEAVKGEFINDEKAKRLFLQWMNEEKYGMPYKDIAVLTALVHDIGKILFYEENGENVSIVKIQKDGTTVASGHEYWGATLVPKILTESGVSNDVATYIANLVKLHGVLMFPDFDKEKTLEEHISDMKALGRGVEKEILFNISVDVATCLWFQDWLQIIMQMFNSEKLYQKREYFVA